MKIASIQFDIGKLPSDLAERLAADLEKIATEMNEPDIAYAAKFIREKSKLEDLTEMEDVELAFSSFIDENIKLSVPYLICALCQLINTYEINFATFLASLASHYAAHHSGAPQGVTVQ